MKLNKKILGLLAIPVIAGGAGAVALGSTTTHAESKPAITSQKDVAEPGDTPDSPHDNDQSKPDLETND